MRKKVLELIQDKRQQLQIDREYLKKAKLLTDFEKRKIAQELDELRKLEIESEGWNYGTH